MEIMWIGIGVMVMAIFVTEIIKVILKKVRKEKYKAMPKTYQTIAAVITFTCSFSLLYFCIKTTLNESLFYAGIETGLVPALYAIYQDWGIRGLLRYISKKVSKNKTIEEFASNIENDNLNIQGNVSKEELDLSQALEIVATENNMDAEQLDNYLKYLKN